MVVAFIPKGVLTVENKIASYRPLEALANIATIVVSLLLSIVLVRQFLLPRPRRAQPAVGAQASRGTDLTRSLPGIDWGRNGRTLVLAISTGCHFCTESGPFFQRIKREAGKDVKLLAVLPQSTAEAEKYLGGLGVKVDEVRQTGLNSIGVTGTPTLLLVGKSGIVTDVWEGKLQPEQQQQVLAALRDDGSARK